MKNPIFEGGCLCGAVRFRIEAAATDAAHCHCQTCRRAHAAAFVTWATFPAKSVRFTSGTPSRYRSSERVVRTFCGRCGTPLSYQRDDLPDELDVSVCSFDEPDRVPPTSHIWISHRVSWLALGDDLPQYPKTRPEAQAN